MNGHANGHAAAQAAVVVFGMDDKGRYNAFRFGPSEAVAARKATSAMGMHAIGLKAPDHRELMAKLPLGRTFGSGKAFVPFVKASLYESLVARARVPLVGRPKRKTPVSR